MLLGIAFSDLRLECTTQHPSTPSGARLASGRSLGIAATNEQVRAIASHEPHILMYYGVLCPKRCRALVKLSASNGACMQPIYQPNKRCMVFSDEAHAKRTISQMGDAKTCILLFFIILIDIK